MKQSNENEEPSGKKWDDGSKFDVSAPDLVGEIDTDTAPSRRGFRPGASGNPKGRPPKTITKNDLVRKWREVKTTAFEGLLEKAKVGDVESIRLCLEIETTQFKEIHGAIKDQLDKLSRENVLLTEELLTIKQQNSILQNHSKVSELTTQKILRERQEDLKNLRELEAYSEKKNKLISEMVDLMNLYDKFVQASGKGLAPKISDSLKGITKSIADNKKILYDPDSFLSEFLKIYRRKG